jgi:hypothetical protein
MTSFGRDESPLDVARGDPEPVEESVAGPGRHAVTISAGSSIIAMVTMVAMVAMEALMRAID